jgi:hypothetical protein
MDSNARRVASSGCADLGLGPDAMQWLAHFSHKLTAVGEADASQFARAASCQRRARLMRTGQGEIAPGGHCRAGAGSLDEGQGHHCRTALAARVSARIN